MAFFWSQAPGNPVPDAHYSERQDKPFSCRRKEKIKLNLKNNKYPIFYFSIYKYLSCVFSWQAEPSAENDSPGEGTAESDGRAHSETKGD